MASNKTYRGEKKDENFLLTALISRRLAYPFALLFCKLGIPANAVTIAGGLFWVASSAAMALAGRLLADGYTVAGFWLLGFSLFAVNFGVILDVADGSVARMTNTSSSAGYFLDYIFHLIFHPMYFCSIGIFIYLTAGHNPLYLVLGVLSICSGWGGHFSAKEHVLCDHIAKGAVDLSKFSDEERYLIYVDSPATRQTVEHKSGLKRLVKNLIMELLLFPGQYTTFSAVILLDLILMHYAGTPPFVLLRILFTVLTVVTLLRVPFRVHREFNTMKKYDEIRSRQLG